MEFSAANLVKRTAKQLTYYSKNTRTSTKEVSPMVIRGDSFASACVYQYGGPGDMRGIFKEGDHTIFFCVDNVVNGDIHEYKSLTMAQESRKEIIAKWYTRSAIVQVAFYSAMVKLQSQNLVTPSFKKNYKKEKVTLKESHKCLVRIGNQISYEVVVKNPKAITDFFISKANSIGNYDKSTAWDNKNGRDYFNYLSRFFSYKRV